MNNKDLSIGDRVRFVMYFRYIKPTIRRKITYNPPLEWVGEVSDIKTSRRLTVTERNRTRVTQTLYQLKNWYRGMEDNTEAYFRGDFLEKI